MLVKITLALCMMIMLGYSVAIGAQRRDTPAAAAAVQAEFQALRGFALAVDEFLDANRGFDGALTWDGRDGSTALAAQPTTPPGLRAVAMPRAWKAVAASGRDHVLCATVSEATLRLVAATMPDAVRARRSGTAVVFDRDPAEADDLAARCGG